MSESSYSSAEQEIHGEEDDFAPKIISKDHEQLLQAATSYYEGIVQALQDLGYDSDTDKANFHGTPARAAKGLFEIVKPLSYIKSEIDTHIRKSFPARAKPGMIISHNNFMTGMCPHHLLPVLYRVSLAYIPKPGENGGVVLGISKLSRIAELLASRPVLQEDLAADIADIFYGYPGIKKAPFPHIESEGSAVYVEGLHTCMACRGAKKHESRLISSEIRGAFMDSNSKAREEFIQIVTSRAGSLLGSV